MSKDWYPQFDLTKCTDCSICYSFCPNGVIGEQHQKPVLVNAEKCPTGCRGCQSRCPADAISYFGDAEKCSGSGCGCSSSSCC